MIEKLSFLEKVGQKGGIEAIVNSLCLSRWNMVDIVPNFRLIANSASPEVRWH